jgi:hypothetical protein
VAGKYMRKLLFTFFIFLLATSTFAQGTFIPLGSEAYNFLERIDIKYSKIVPVQNVGDKPMYRSTAARVAETLLLSNLRLSKVQKWQLQYLTDENAEWLDSLQSRTSRPLFKVLYREPASFAHVTSKKKGLFDIRFNPIIAASVGAESQNNRFVFSRSVGLEVRGNIKRVFSFYFNVTGNSARPSKYVTEKVIRSTYNPYVYVPGQAYWKDYSSSLLKFSDGIDYFDARGYVNVNLLKYINLSFGRDKFFIGNGQRSLFLSDYSAPYLFLRFNLNVWRFNYQSIFAELNSQYIRGTDQLLPKKYMAVHHLSIQATHWFNIGLFEAVVLNRSNHFELQYLNPIIFYRAVEHSIGSPDNVLLGGDWKMNFANHFSIYGQFLLDEFNFKHFFKRDGWWANKWALQAGLKYIDIVPNLDAQFEFNAVRPFTYTHEADINYSNYNQPLAHPLGANFYEVILNLHYQPVPKFSVNARYIAAVLGGDTLINGTLTNYGGDILRSSGGGTTVTQELNNKLAQGARGNLNYFQLLVSYQAWHNIYFDMDILYRSRSTLKSLNNPLQSESSFIFNVGLRMNVPYRANAF